MKKMLKATFSSQGLPARDIKNANRLNLWVFAWVVTLIIAVLVADWEPRSEWQASILLIILAIVTHAGVSIGVILKFKRFLQEADEMERKIQLDSLAFSLGAVFVGWSVYSLLVLAKLVADKYSVYIIVLMSITYAVGLIVGRIRYR